MSKIWDLLCVWEAALTGALLVLFRKRHAPPWLLAGLTVLPVLFMLLALAEDRAALRGFNAVNASGSLCIRSLWLYSVTATQTPDSWPAGLADMERTRTGLRARYPREVQATDDAWAAFSGSLRRTGRVDWPTASWMRDSASVLTSRIAARAQSENTHAFHFLLAGMLAPALSLAASFRLMRLLRRAELLQRRLSSVMDACGEYIGLAEPGGRLVYANRAFRRLRGLDECADLASLRLPDLYAPGARPCLIEEILPATVREGCWEGELAFLEAQGQEVPAAQTLLAHQGPDGVPDGVAFVARDLSEQRRCQTALTDSQAALERCSREAARILDRQSEGLYVLDCGWRMTRMNPAAERLLGKAPVQFSGKTFWDVFPDLAGATFQELCFQCLVERAPADWEFCYTPRQTWLRVQVHPSETGVLLFFADITLRVQAERQSEGYAAALEAKTALLETKNQELERQTILASAHKAELEAQAVHLEKLNRAMSALANVDTLTTLKNHRAFQEQLGLEVQRAVRYSTPLALILLDLDHFRQYNERFGHPAGDSALKAVAQILKKALRETDLVARYGGEEFALLLPQTDAAGAHILAERLRVSIAGLALPCGSLTISLGISAVDRRLSEPGALVGQALEALACAKSRGRNQTASLPLESVPPAA